MWSRHRGLVSIYSFVNIEARICLIRWRTKFYTLPFWRHAIIRDLSNLSFPFQVISSWPKCAGIAWMTTATQVYSITSSYHNAKFGIVMSRSRCNFHLEFLLCSFFEFFSVDLLTFDVSSSGLLFENLEKRFSFGKVGFGIGLIR